jgi:hypothetical protein
MTFTRKGEAVLQVARRLGDGDDATEAGLNTRESENGVYRPPQTASERDDMCRGAENPR